MPAKNDTLKKHPPQARAAGARQQESSLPIDIKMEIV
jgi:hypothetical protein